MLEKGGWKLSLPGAFMLALLASMGGGIVSWLSKPSPENPAAVAAAIRSEMDKAKEDNKGELVALTKRVGDVEGEMKLFRLSVDALNNRVTDRLNLTNPPRVDPLAAPMNQQLSPH